MHLRSRRISLFITVVFLFLASRSQAQYQVAFPFQDPIDYDKIDLYLHTVDVGSDIYTRFGHSALRLVDRRSGADLVFNWGIFNYDISFILMFPLKVLRNDLFYTLGIYPNQVAHRIYRIEGRNVWQDRINLTRNQKKRLMDKLIWNAMPENREYLYDFYYDNCSTKIRDYLSDVLGGGPKAQFVDVTSGESFRTTTRHHMATDWLLQPSIDVIMAKTEDLVMTEWEKMFLPMSLRHYYLKVPRYDDANKPIPSSTLLSDGEVLYQFDKPAAPVIPDIVIYTMVFTILLILAVGSWYLFRNRPALSIRLFAFFSALWFFGASFYGVFMFLGATIAKLRVVQDNANLLLFWPTDALLFVQCIIWLVRGTKAKVTGRKIIIIKYYVVAHLLSASILAVLYFTGFFMQDVSWVVKFFLPLHLAYLAFFLQAARSKVSASV